MRGIGWYVFGVWDSDEIQKHCTVVLAVGTVPFVAFISGMFVGGGTAWRNWGKSR